jgi:hypothetical protein
VVQQQLINTPTPETSSSAASEPAAALVSRDFSPAVDQTPMGDQFAGLLEPLMEMPNLCSLESSDSFWKEILEDSYRL